MKEDIEGKIPPGVMTILQDHMRNLEKALLVNDPQMPSYLKESHRILITHPETVHLLDDEEIGQLITAAQKFTDTQIVAALAKTKSTGRKVNKLSTDADGNIDL